MQKSFPLSRVRGMTLRVRVGHEKRTHSLLGFGVTAQARDTNSTIGTEEALRSPLLVEF